MDREHWLELAALLQVGHLEFDPGLTDLEVEATEEKFNFRFPPDLRAFLQTIMPAHIGFHDWRDGNETRLRKMLDWPLQGCLYDVEHNGFWLPEWGPRPELLADALEIAKAKITEAPKLIPIYSHRFIPGEPRESGNPVFSVHQMDIIYYGFDLDDYLRHEFNLPGRKDWPAQVRPISFWDPDRFQKLRWT
ncbi:MAG TPA: hypothetical protein VGG80_06805 [Acidobacteriaceae bacterium]|jgi:hypothetical protein